MVDGLTFDKARLNFGYGLVRLSSELKLIDKNKKAENTHVFPKRGAGILKYTDDGGKRLLSISEKAGDNVVVSVSDGIKRVEALAIREEGGTLMLLLHPLITSVTLGKSGKTSIAYGLNILSVIYGENIERRYSLNEIFPYAPLAVKRLTLVTTTVKLIAERLSKINFKNSITVNFEGMEARLSAAVDFTSVIYAFTEILSLENSFSDGKSARITFSSTDTTFDIILNARMKKNAVSDAGVFKRLFSEALSLIGVSATADFSQDGFIFAKASVKTEIATSYVREPGVFIEDAVFGYFDYSMKYYGFGEKEQ